MAVALCLVLWAVASWDAARAEAQQRTDVDAAAERASRIAKANGPPEPQQAELLTHHVRHHCFVYTTLGGVTETADEVCH
jgi:hypothetical protein